MAQVDPYKSLQQVPAATSSATNAPTALDPAVVRAFMSDLQKRAGIVNSMADKFTNDAAATYGSTFSAFDWKRDFGARLMQQPTIVLASASSAPNLGMAQNEVFNAASRVTAKHSTDVDLQLHVLTPCRIVDTRSGGGGQLGPAYRNWQADATPAIISAQGGNAAGCGNYPNAQGWLLYVTVVPPSGNAAPNFIAVQHDASPAVPTSAAINFVNQNIANFVIVSNFTSGSGGGFYAYSSGLSHVVIDLIGYSTRSENTYGLDCVTTAVNQLFAETGTSNTGAPGIFTLNVPACPSGYVQTGVNCNASGDNASTNLQSATGVSCKLYADHTHSITGTDGASGRCCRIPSGI